ncbi:Putative ribonuclease H protein At1g65750 [Linum perenne]
MERLSHLIDEAVSEGSWLPISLSPGGPELSHLFYANDLILFGAGSIDQAKVITKCLDRFCASSGQAVSKEKSIIFCSKNTDRRVCREISAELAIPLTQDLGRYLGVPVLHGRTTKATYLEILDRIDQKLLGWKAKSLSLAGRVTLAHSVLSAIPAYAMQTSVLPATTCSDIDKRIRDFIWGSSPQERKIHLVSWEKICEAKEDGGLGLRSSRLLNRAFMVKLAFTFFKEQDSLWVRVLQGKYFRDTQEGLRRRNLKSQSAVWKGLSAEWEVMLRGSRSAIRDGRETMFWTARWVDSGVQLINLVNVDPRLINVEDTVRDFVTEDGSWDFAKLRSCLAEDTVAIVAGMAPPRDGIGGDQWSWGLEKDGGFRIKSAYALIKESACLDPNDFWKKIWKWRGPHRVRHFLWLAGQDHLLTNSQRTKGKLANDHSCSLCPSMEENSNHVLRDCNFARETWRAVDCFNLDDASWAGSLQDWIGSHLVAAEGLLFGLVCWALWNGRNSRLFAGGADSPESVARRIVAWARIVDEALDRDGNLLDLNLQRREVEIAWEPGPQDSVTVNTDGAVMMASGSAAAGGLLRNADGRCFAAFTANLGCCSITRAEMRGAIIGLQTAWKQGHMKIELQMDSQAAIQLLVSTEEPTHQHAMEVYEFQELLSRNWEVSIRHTYREGNHAADFLAGIGHSYPLGVSDIAITNASLGYFLRYDCMGVSEPRTILLNN